VTGPRRREKAHRGEMAFPQSGEAKERPEAGQILIVIREWIFVCDRRGLKIETNHFDGTFHEIAMKSEIY
jgi:hypothetical protein